jgi:predicted PurR-regulated permease PerM
MPDTLPARSLPPRVLQIVVAAALVAVLYALSDVVLILFFAVLLACVLHGVARFLARKTPLHEGYALALVAIAIATVSVAIAYWIVPELIREGHQLYAQLNGELGWLRVRFGLASPPGPGGGSGLGLGVLHGHLAAPLKTAVGMSLSVIAGAVVVVVSALYLAADPELYMRGVLHLFPFRLRPRLREVMIHVGTTLKYWVLGQLVDMVVVGVLSGAGMALLGVPTPFALGVLSGLLTFVPYFGAILAAVPAGLVALTVSWQTALWTLGVYTLCHCIEGYVIAPLVQRRFVDLPPALTVASMTIAGSLFGLLGLTLGTPLAATALVMVRMLYVEDALGDHTVHKAGLAVTDVETQT